MQNKIFNKDCIKGMKLLNNDSINLIIADPPYNLNKNFGVYNEKKEKNSELNGISKRMKLPLE